MTHSLCVELLAKGLEVGLALGVPFVLKIAAEGVHLKPLSEEIPLRVNRREKERIYYLSRDTHNSIEASCYESKS